MKSRYFLLFVFLISFYVTVDSAHFARRCFQFVKEYSVPLAGVVLSFFDFQYTLSDARDVIDEYIELEEKQKGEINHNIKKLIKDECERHGFNPYFIVYEPIGFGNMAVTGDGVRNGLSVGDGWGLNLSSCDNEMSEASFKFTIGHESTHARYHDSYSKIGVIGLGPFIMSVVWYMSRVSGRGRAFSLLVSACGGELLDNVLFSILSRRQEFRADRESVEYNDNNLEVIDSQIAFLECTAAREKERLATIESASKGSLSHEEVVELSLAIYNQMNRLIYYPPDTDRIERLEQMKKEANK